MRTNLNQIIREVAEKHRLTVAELFGPSRENRYAFPRMEVYFRAFTECPHLSYPEIGRRVGKDHTTVLHGVRRHCERIGLDYEEAKAMRFSVASPVTLARKWAEYEAVMREARAA